MSILLPPPFLSPPFFPPPPFVDLSQKPAVLCLSPVSGSGEEKVLRDKKVLLLPLSSSPLLRNRLYLAFSRPSVRPSVVLSQVGPSLHLSLETEREKEKERDPPLLRPWMSVALFCPALFHLAARSLLLLFLLLRSWVAPFLLSPSSLFARGKQINSRRAKGGGGDREGDEKRSKGREGRGRLSAHFLGEGRHILDFVILLGQSHDYAVPTAEGRREEGQGQGRRAGG